MHFKRIVLILILVIGVLCCGCNSEIREKNESISNSGNNKEDNLQQLTDDDGINDSVYVLDVDYSNGCVDITDLKKQCLKVTESKIK